MSPVKTMLIAADIHLREMAEESAGDSKGNT
jgi:hypothetical protein